MNLDMRNEIAESSDGADITGCSDGSLPAVRLKTLFARD